MYSVPKKFHIASIQQRQLEELKVSQAKAFTMSDDDELVTKPFKFVTGKHSSVSSHGG